jgi:hypothetical protein
MGLLKIWNKRNIGIEEILIYLNTMMVLIIYYWYGVILISIIRFFLYSYQIIINIIFKILLQIDIIWRKFALKSNDPHWTSCLHHNPIKTLICHYKCYSVMRCAMWASRFDIYLWSKVVLFCFVILRLPKP